MHDRLSFRERAGIALSSGLVAGAVAGAMEGLFLNLRSLGAGVSEIIYGLGIYAAFGATTGLVLAAVWSLPPAGWTRRWDRVAIPLTVSFHVSVFVLVLAGYRLNKIPWMPRLVSPAGLAANLLIVAAVVGTGVALGVGLARLHLDTRTKILATARMIAPVLLCATLLMFLAGGWMILFNDQRWQETEPEARAEFERPGVILLLSDALRKDHLSGYGYERRTSPSLDRFMAESVTFENAFSTSNQTLPAIASLFTGVSPSTLGPFRVGSPLPGGLPTQAEVMAEAGYVCGCFLGNGIVEAGEGFLRGFHYRYPPPEPFWCLRQRTAVERMALRLIRGTDYHLGPPLLEDAKSWIRRYGHRPFYAFIHVLDPHSPYKAPPPYDRLFDPDYDGPPAKNPPLGLLPPYRDFRDWESQESAKTSIGERRLHNMIAQYDGEIAYTDSLMGAFLHDLAEMGVYEDALVVFTSDHGEEFYEHGGWFHGHSLYDELVRVPLIVKLPRGRGAGTRRTDPVALSDVMPSVLSATGIDTPDGVEGVDVLGQGGIQPDGRPLFSERPPHIYSVREGPWKLVQKELVTGSEIKLFHLADDPGETVNVAARFPEVRDRLAEMLAGRIVTDISVEEPELDALDRERLKALGYLQ